MELHHVPKTDPSPFARLRTMTVVGGFHDGQGFDFANGLNCVIGARGTGKTSLLEFVRYALDAMPADPVARRRVEDLVAANLNGGRIELSFATKDGLAYTISRSAGENPIVLDESGKPTEISLASGGLFSADIYSQNSIERIAQDATSQLALIDTFESDRITDLAQRMRTIKADLDASASSIAPLQKKIAVLEDEIASLPSVVEKLRAYGDEGGAQADAINAAHMLKSLRDREQRTVAAATKLLEDLGCGLGQAHGAILARLPSITTPDVLEGPNAHILVPLLQSLRVCGSDMDEHLRRALDRLREESDSVAARAARLASVHREQELAFRSTIERHEEARGRAAERVKLEKRRNELLAKQTERDECGTRLRALVVRRGELVDQLSDLRDERFAIRTQIVERINRGVGPAIRVSLVQYGNSEEYVRLLEMALKNGRVKRCMVAQKIAEAFDPDEIATLIEARDAQSLIDTAGLNPEQAQKAIHALADSRILFELDTVERADLPSIELNDRGTYKGTSSLSAGQRCNTILPILLLESGNPLLVDQPEDNLDNRFVSETVVESIRRVKAARQLVFVTHNANIPVLGDAEKIFVLDSDGQRSHRRSEGSVDDCRDDIVNLLEGGEEAFRERQGRYSFR